MTFDVALGRDVLTVIGVGGIGAAIARRSGSGKTVLLADNNDETLASVVESLSAAGHQVLGRRVDVASAESVRGLAQYAASLGTVTNVAHTAAFSPAQASAQAILAVDLLGVALMLQEFGEVVAPGGAGVVIASMAGHLVPPLTTEQEHALAHNPPGDLLSLDFVSQVTEPAFAYPIAKQAKSGTGRIGTPDDIAAAAAFLLGADASLITGTDLLVDGGVVAAVRSGS
ncbi:SDR family oxidoreductase [Mycobacterium persicum]|uniref:SDR family oxidoreductase n=1 Tax=Mycobacterium persicum TaxID=1487726 RepID=UPI0015937D5D|nr:SDR family oxidoreductase [Mycobacterium persicum]